MLEKIEQEFKFFPRLHCIFASRPNVTPIAITTALGPNGPKTTYYQPPDSVIDPQLLDQPRASGSRIQAATPSSPTTPESPPPSFSQSMGSNTPNTPFIPTINYGGEEKIPTLTPKRSAKPSLMSREALGKAQVAIQKVPAKRTIIDVLSDLQR